MESSVVDLQALVSRSLERLVELTGCDRALAWSRGADGAPITLASAFQRSTPPTPTDDAFAALVRLEVPMDLGAADAPAPLVALGELGLAAGAPVGRSQGEAAVVLLLGGPGDPPGAVRPRTLAALGAAARRLDTPAAAAAALARLTELDEEVCRLDRLAALGDLVSEIVHEVRNPLVSIKTFLQLLPDRADDAEFRTHFLEVVADETRRIERLLDVVLEQARPRSVPPDGASTEVGPVFDAVARLLAHRVLERGITLETAVDAGASVAMGADPLRQVVLNLTLNALDVTPAGGRVRLSARDDGSRVELCVEDEGPGISESLRPRIFEPFFSTKAERPGGLGLAICRRLAEEAGGGISVCNRSEGGAAFRVTLRRSDPEMDAETDPDTETS